MKNGEAGNVLIADARNLTKYVMKILMLGGNPIGDNLAYILPMSAVIHQEGHELHCMMPNKQIFNLFSDMPYFTNLIQVPIIGHKASEERIREFVEFLPQYRVDTGIYGILGIIHHGDQRDRQILHFKENTLLISAIICGSNGNGGVCPDMCVRVYISLRE